MSPAAAPAAAILMRHAHADWPAYTGRDFDRPLTPRGEEAARAAAQAIQVAGHRPAVIIASPARRTRQTAVVLAGALGLPAERLEFVDTLYNARATTLEAELRRGAPAGLTTLLVAHNPGISELARQLAGNPGRAPFEPAGWDVFPLPAR